MRTESAEMVTSSILIAAEARTGVPIASTTALKRSAGAALLISTSFGAFLPFKLPANQRSVASGTPKVNPVALTAWRTTSSGFFLT